MTIRALKDFWKKLLQFGRYVIIALRYMWFIIVMLDVAMFINLMMLGRLY